MSGERHFHESDGTLIPPYGLLLQEQAKRFPESALALIDDEGITYRQTYDQAYALACSLRAMGVGRGDHVAVLMPNCTEFITVFFATQLIGGVIVPVNARYKSYDLAHVLAHSDVKALFTTARIEDHVNFIDLVWETLPELASAPGARELNLKATPALKRIVLFGASTAPKPAISAGDFLSEGVSSGESEVLASDVSVDDVALILYTSGTTAAPKGCQLTHRGLYHSWLNGYAQAVRLSEGEKVWAPLPFFHVGGIGPMTAVLARGAVMLSSIHFKPEEALRQIRHFDPEHLYPGFFTMMLPVLREPGYVKDDLNFARSAIMVAPYDTQLMIAEMFPATVVVLQVYAMTEASGYVTLTRPDGTVDHRLKTSGVPLPGVDVRIVAADSGEIVPAGLDGEIQFQGPVAFNSYYKDEIETRKTILEDGWVSTGDHGRMDSEGNVYFLGRIKDMLKVGGENVAAAEIEGYIGTHPAVKLAQVVARPDQDYGEVAVAFVELKPDKDVSEAEIIDFCHGRLARFKVPREVRFVDQWPMSTTKIQKFKLREQLQVKGEG